MRTRGLLQHDDAPVVERLGDLDEVREEERCVVTRSAARPSPEDHYRRLDGSELSEDGPEIGVGRDEDPTLVAGKVEDLLVSRPLHAHVAAPAPGPPRRRSAGPR